MYPHLAYAMFGKYCQPNRAIRLTIAFLAVMLSIGSSLYAQDPSGLEQGIKAYGSYDGGNLDSVNLMNGSLSLHIPLISYPQRGGKLNIGFSIAYSNPTIGFLNGQPNCPVPNEPNVCYPKNGRYYFEANSSAAFLGTYGVHVTPNFIPAIGPNLYVPYLGACQPSSSVASLTDFEYAVTLDGAIMLISASSGAGDPRGSCVGEMPQVADYTLEESDGATHHLGGTGTQMIGGQGSTPPVSAQWFSRDTSGYVLDVPSATLTDRKGTRYSSTQLASTSVNNPPMCCQTINSIEDVNGNRVITNFTGSPSTGQSYVSWTDTLGRIIPAPTPAGTASTDSTGCTGTLTTTSAYMWSLPGPNSGSYPVKLCYAKMIVMLDPPDCASSPTDWCNSSTQTLALLQSIVLPNKTTWTFTYDSNGCLSQIVFPTGGSISYTWTMTVTGTGAKVLSVFDTYRWVVTSRTTDDGSGSATARSTWHYTVPSNTGGDVVVTDPLNNDTVHQFTAQSASAQGQQFPSYQLYETETDQYAQSFSTGTLLKKTVTAYSFEPDPYSSLYAGPVLMNLVPTSVTTTDMQSGLSSTTTLAYDTGLPLAVHPAGATLNAIFGNVIQKNEYDFTTSSSTPGALLRQTNTVYMAVGGPNSATYLANNLLDLPYTSQVCDGYQNQYALTQFNYDEGSLQASGLSGSTTLDSSPFAGAFRGNSTSTHQWLSTTTAACQANPTVSSSSSITNSKTYYDTGTVYNSLDPLGYPTQYQYSMTYQGAYPTKITNALGQSTQFQYDFNLGFETQAVDVNLQPTLYTHDSLGRLTNVHYPDGGGITYCYSDLGQTRCAGATSTPSLLMTKVQSNGVAAPTNWSVSQPADASSQIIEADVDGLGRKIKTLSLSDPFGLDEVDTTYDLLGRVNSVSNPYDSSNDPSYGITSYQYDALGRMLYQCQPDNSSSNATTCIPNNSYLQWSYSGSGSTSLTGLPVDSYDETGRHWQHTTDGLGRLTKVLEPNSTGSVSGAPTLETDYQYDPLGNLTNVAQLGISGESSRTRKFSYDSLNRLITSNNPENGIISYTYDADGNPVLKTSPDPNATSGTVSLGYCYDQLNRLLSKFYGVPNCSSPGSAVANFQYDTSSIQGATNTIGRLVGEQSLVGGIAVSAISPYSYDPMGRLSAEQQCPYGTCSAPYLLKTYYDVSGHVVDVNNGLTGGNAIYLASGYDGAGRLASLNSSAVGSTPAMTLFQAVAQSGVNPYGAAGLLNAQLGVYSNTPNPSINLERSYDNRMRLVSETDRGFLQISKATGSGGTITIQGIEQTIPASTYASAQLSVTGAESTHQVCTTTNKSPGYNKPPVPVTTCTTVYDTGTLSIVLNAASPKTASAQYSQTTSDQSLASGLASSLTATGLVNATSSGNVITMTSTSIGSVGNYPFQITNGADFDASSQATALSGGQDATSDTGSVTLTLGGVSLGSTNWQQGDSVSSIEGRLISAINSQSSVHASPGGAGTILINSVGQGAVTNSSLLVSVSDTSTEFSKPSFSFTASGMTGGADAVTQNGTVYSYSLAGGFAPNGNIVSYTDSVMGNWSLGYDNLNRLTTTGSVSGAFQGNTGCWSYDSFGNRLGETISTSPCPTSPISILSPANNRLAGMTYSAAGNVTSDGSNSYLYDDENRLCAVRGANGGGLTGYVYDVEGRRVAKGSLTSFSCAPGNGFTLTSQYLYDSSGQQVAELDGAGNPKHNDVYAAGRVLATYDTRGLHFQLTDWLGTKRAQANASGVMEETCTNLPFGNNQICTGATDATEKHFTGKDRDSESGLDFMNARYYSSTAARFVSPDPMLMSNKHLMFPQRWNAYAYVRNNPLTMVDPNGLDDYYVFLPLATSVSPAWGQLMGIAPAFGNTLHVFAGVNATGETMMHYLYQPDAHVIYDGHTIANDVASPRWGLLTNSSVLTDSEHGSSLSSTFTASVSSPDGSIMPALSIDIVPGEAAPLASDVAIFGCQSIELANQFPNGTYIGIDSGTSRETYVAPDNSGGARAALAYTLTSITNQGTEAAAAAAQNGLQSSDYPSDRTQMIQTVNPQ